MRDESTKPLRERSEAARGRRMETMNGAAVAMYWLLGASGALAQTAPPTARPVSSVVSNDQSAATDKSTLEQVVVIGQHMTAPAEVPLETAYSEGTITADTIRALSAGPTVTAQTLLNSQPSIIAFTDGPLGTRSTVYLRSFNAGQFAETYDGVALNDLFNASVTNQASNINNVLLTPNNLDSVEIYRGINNPAVNSYNSLGGTIDYLPRRPTGNFDAEASASYGSFKSSLFRGTVDFGNLYGLKQMLSYEHGESDGWSANTADRNNNLYYSADYSRDNGDRLSVYAIYNDNTGYTPFNMPVPLLQANGDFYQWPKSWTYESDKDSNWMAIVDYESRFNDYMVLRNKIFGGVNDYKRTSYSNPLYQQSATQIYNLENTPNGYPFWLSYPNGPTYDPVAAFGSAEDGTDYHFYGYATRGIGDTLSLALSLPRNVVTMGGNVSYGTLHSREYWYGTFAMPMQQGYNNAWDEQDRRTLTSGYVQDEIALFDDTLHVTPGVKYVHASTSDHDSIGFYYPISGRVSDQESFVSPTLGVNYKVTPDLAIYAAFGRNIKFPDITAYFGAFQNDANGNPVVVPVKVNPEHVDDYELGARYRQSRFSATVNLYRENFTNTFVNQFNSTTGLTTTTNGGSSRYQGIEVQLTEDFAQTAWGDWNGYLNYSHNDAKFTTSFTSDYAGPVTAGQSLGNVPKDLVTAGVVWQMSGWRASAGVRYIGQQHINYLASGTPSPDTISAHTLVDMGIAKIISLDGPAGLRSLRIALNVDNLFDKYYYNESYTDADFNSNSFVRAVPGAPRSVVGTVSLRF
ncbi:MAG: TonB-dependent receptor [Gammaproteobacteria bacterium]|nr:TonB-dependent receptor [Gammaproteobacteria bacterium]